MKRDPMRDALFEVIENIDYPYTTALFRELTNEEHHKIRQALHNCGVAHASDRLHAHWSRHIKSVTRFRALKTLDDLEDFDNWVMQRGSYARKNRAEATE